MICLTLDMRIEMLEYRHPFVFLIAATCHPFPVPRSLRPPHGSLLVYPTSAGI